MSAHLYPSADLNSTLAASGQWHAMPAEAHSVQFYGEDESLLEGLSRFIGAALGAGDAAVVIATPAHRSALNKRLRALGLDVQLAASEGRFIVLDAAATLSKFVVNGQLHADRFNEIIGKVLTGVRASCRGENPRIAAFGEMVALLWADGKAEQGRARAILERPLPHLFFPSALRLSHRLF